MKRLFSCLVLMTVLALPVQANFQEGVSAYQSGNFVRAAALWQTAAEAGDAAAQRNLGLMYLNGQGVNRDATRAADLFRQAADQSFSPAAANLADLYLRGVGVPRDLARSFTYMRLAADGGLMESQHNLGVYYEHGVGTDKDEDVAVFWYRRAASGGFEKSVARLAELRPDDAPVEALQPEVPPTARLATTRTEPAGDGLMDNLVTLFAPSE